MSNVTHEDDEFIILDLEGISGTGTTQVVPGFALDLESGGLVVMPLAPCPSDFIFFQSFKYPHIPFADRYAGRIARDKGLQPRSCIPYLEWNRKIKWRPRFFSAPSRKQHFSQSRLRLSQVLSLGHPIIGRLRRDSSQGLLSH